MKRELHVEGRQSAEQWVTIARWIVARRDVNVFDISGHDQRHRFQQILVTSVEAGYNFWMTGRDDDLVEFRLKFLRPGLRVEFENRFLK